MNIYYFTNTIPRSCGKWNISKRISFCDVFCQKPVRIECFWLIPNIGIMMQCLGDHGNRASFRDKVRSCNLRNIIMTMDIVSI